MRKSIFRTPDKPVPNGAGVQKFYFCACEKAFSALRIRQFRTDPECKNSIFAHAKKHFPHSG
ncbi:Uncharacterized protein dnm_032890 [Desulfonema magnum]|uniref:Uncharacterized protein n=1 Tax=Desulfonema magnum TaxID=45655 RepID=A0A975BK93_9BACT|nr:Uncharacterized protein dnm_032890 [Desulfonema magnum]